MTMHTVIHTSPSEIKAISKDGLFNDCLFFSDEEYAMGNVGAVYSLDINEDKIVDASDLHDDEIIAHISSALDVDTDVAENLLDGSDSAIEHGLSGEDDWWIQAKQGECAKKMGYEAVRGEDEQGTVYIVPMLGRESDLVRLK